MKKERHNSNFKEIAEDAVKALLAWIAVTVGGFAYWMAMLLLASIMLLNVWDTSIEQILQYGIILTAITSLVYAIILVRRKLK